MIFEKKNSVGNIEKSFYVRSQRGETGEMLKAELFRWQTGLGFHFKIICPFGLPILHIFNHYQFHLYHYQFLKWKSNNISRKLDAKRINL